MSPFMARSISVRGRGAFPVTGVNRMAMLQCGNLRKCEGFRMPAPRRWCHAHRGPAYENLQGRKPRIGSVRWRDERAARYGDLSTADRVCGRVRLARWRGSLASRRLGDRVSRDTAGSSGIDWRARSGVDAVLPQASSWPVRSQRNGRAVLRRRGSGVVVMRCRS